MHKLQVHDGKWIKTDSKDYIWYVFIYIMFGKVKNTGIDKISGLPETEKTRRIKYKGERQRNLRSKKIILCYYDDVGKMIPFFCRRS